MNLRIIKSTDEYQAAVGRVTDLVLLDPAVGSPEAEQLELLALLIEDYEKKSFQIETPDPVSAIEYRMEEQGLRQRDLIPILGSRSRVSEVLARKRPLSLQMIRSLSESLAISTDILIKPTIIQDSDEADAYTDWKKYPFREMQRRGWIPDAVGESPESLVKAFLARSSADLSGVPMFRRKIRGLGVNELEERAAYSTIAWAARVIQAASTRPDLPNFQLSNLSEEFLTNLAKFSTLEDGPLRAINEIKKIGIHVVIEPQLPGTLIDGAALLDTHGTPVIGLTLRYDRIDYFWFTLLHEVAHVWKHLNSSREGFIDRIDAHDEKERSEKEANRIARDCLISRNDWARSAARLNPSTATIRQFSYEIGVHPAIVAGRVRFETGDYRKFDKLLGQGSVRKLFDV